jgi:hypothetical protein
MQIKRIVNINKDKLLSISAVDRSKRLLSCNAMQIKLNKLKYNRYFTDYASEPLIS